MEGYGMKIIQIQKKNQLTLPADIRKKLQLKERDFLAIEIEDNRIILTPQKIISREQEWFWTGKWQEGEKEADEDFEAGRYKDFEDIDELLRDLNS